MKRAPSLTWFFIAIAAVLVAGFAWLEFHQHGQAVPSEAIASSWQPPRIEKRESLAIKPPKPSAPKSKSVSMATSSRKAPPKRSLAKEPPPPERNYDDMPAPTDRDDPIEPEQEDEGEGTFQEVASEDIEAEKAEPEKLSMKGFSDEMNKLPENLQKEFEDLSEEHGDGQAKTEANPKNPSQDQEAESVPPPHGQDNGDGTETGDVDPSSQRPPE